MARRLKSFNWNGGSEKKSKYPWDKWLDGSIWQLTQGRDYAIKTSSLRVTATKEAKERGLKLRTKIVDSKCLVIQAYKED